MPTTLLPAFPICLDGAASLQPISYFRNSPYSIVPNTYNSNSEKECKWELFWNLFGEKKEGFFYLLGEKKSKKEKLPTKNKLFTSLITFFSLCCSSNVLTKN